MNVRWAFNFNNWNPTENELLLATSCIQTDEKERLNKFVFRNDFKASLIGRLLMRKYINIALKIPYNEIILERDEKGKPFLPHYKSISFNVSHQGNYVVFAGALGRQTIGVDVMKMEYTGGKDINNFFRIMSKNFSQYEWNTIKYGHNVNEHIGMFYRHWCLKESYVKALGVGITINLQDISFKINTKQLQHDQVVTDTELYVKNKKVNWLFEECLLGELNDHVVAVAINKSEGEPNDLVHFEEFNFQELMEGSSSLLEPDLNYCKGYFTKLQR